MIFKQEFQAVVLAAGKGSRMPELTAGIPKCLLPVGNKPLIWFPLYKLQQTGFTDVIVVVAENQKNEIQNTIEKSDLVIKIDYFCVPISEDLGTADSLRLMHDKLQSDVLIISCDFISNINIHDVLNLFRKHNASVCSLFFNMQNAEQVLVPGPKSKHKPERDLIGIDAKTDRLVFLASASDFEANLILPKVLLKKHTNITMHSNLIDSHVYVLKNWIIKYLVSEPNISTVKGELLPHIIKKQLSKPQQAVDTNASIVNLRATSDIFQFAKESPLELLIRNTSTYNDHSGDLKPCYHNDSIRCFAHIADDNFIGVRVNTLTSYWSINGKIIDIWKNLTDSKDFIKVDPRAEIKSTQIDDRCIIWESSRLSEKTSFKNSNIGSNVQVESFTRVFNSIIMNNVVIKEKVALENCIVCDGAVIESGSQLKECLVGSQHVVPELSEHANEVLTESDKLMEF